MPWAPWPTVNVPATAPTAIPMAAVAATWIDVLPGEASDLTATGQMALPRHIFNATG